MLKPPAETTMLKVSEIRRAVHLYRNQMRPTAILDEIDFETLIEYANIGANVVEKRGNVCILARIGTIKERDLG